MAAVDSQTRRRLVPIAPAPPDSRGPDAPITPAPADFLGPNVFGAKSQTPPVRTCQACSRRKVKCDKETPCSACRKSKVECIYPMSTSQRPKRRFDDDVLEKLERYERILQQHGLLDVEAGITPSDESTLHHEPISLHWNEPSPSRPGELLGRGGKSRYVDNSLWRNLGANEMQDMSDDGEVEECESQAVVVRAEEGVSSDPLTAAFLTPARGQGLLEYHPTHTMAMMLWEAYSDQVDPVFKILHIPSTAKMIDTISKQPGLASKADECLLFSVYHFAVFSMTEAHCTMMFGEPRDILRRRYHRAARQALVNASFLKTTDLAVLQAFVLFLAAAKASYDSQTYWVLTGVAIRIAQRIGLHRDGEALDLPPFEVQIRRRLFYQLIPLEGNACQMVGAGPSMPPDAWDTKPPLNINDDQMWPGIGETPQETNGATEMIFVLSRLCIGKSFARGAQAGRLANPGSSHHFRDYHEAELAISNTEREVEEKYIRYCDVVNPLHFLAVCLARSGVTAMRLRIRLPKFRSGTVTHAERMELFRLAQKTMDADAAANANPGLRKYEWYMRTLFVWGMWESLILVLTILRRHGDDLSALEARAGWTKVGQVYENHAELVRSSRALHIALRRLTLRAWDGQPERNRIMEPAFVSTLRSVSKDGALGRAGSRERNGHPASTATQPPTIASHSTVSNTAMTAIFTDPHFDDVDHWNLDNDDSLWWDNLTQDWQQEVDTERQVGR